jgi:hypothetical protein
MVNMVFIPVGREYNATHESTVPKDVTCEQCGREFYYLMKRQASGSASSPLFLDNRGASQRARDRAEEELRRLLVTECDPVPCPECGWYQSSMFATIRRSYRRWMLWAGAVLLAVAAPCLATTISCAMGVQPTDDSTVSALWIVSSSLAVAGFGIIVGRQIMALRHDPNATDPEERRRIGQSVTFRREELEDQLRLLGGRDGPDA